MFSRSMHIRLTCITACDLRTPQHVRRDDARSPSGKLDLPVRETISFLTGRFLKLSRGEAYMIASIAVDYHVTHVVDGTKGIHGMIPKAIFSAQ